MGAECDERVPLRLKPLTRDTETISISTASRAAHDLTLRGTWTTLVSSNQGARFGFSQDELPLSVYLLNSDRQDSS